MPKRSKNSQVVEALKSGEGILRLAPTWVPRSSDAGSPVETHPDDYYAMSATEAESTSAGWPQRPTANESREPDEGWSYDYGKDRFTLRDAVKVESRRLIGKKIWDQYKRWPVCSKFFDNLGPIPHHMHQDDEQAKLPAVRASRVVLFPPAQQWQQFIPHTYFGLEPGTTKEDIRRCLETWNKGDNGILDYSKAYRASRTAGWSYSRPACPGSILTYEPQWGSDVFAMYQSMVEGAASLGPPVKDVPKSKHHDLDYLVEQLTGSGMDAFPGSSLPEPIPTAPSESEGWIDGGWFTGRFEKTTFSAKELTLQPGTRCTIRDGGATVLSQSRFRTDRHAAARHARR
jgi:hypothetical protein